MPNGNVDFFKIFNTPAFNRIPALIEGLGYELVHFIVCKLLFDLRASINVRTPMTDKQVMNAAGMVIKQCMNEFLGLEDMVCFFERLKTGKYGELWRLDVQVISDALEKYRSERIIAYDNYQYELKTNGYAARSSNRRLKFDDHSGHYIESPSQNDWPEKGIDVQKELQSLTKKYTNDITDTNSDAAAGRD